MTSFIWHTSHTICLIHIICSLFKGHLRAYLTMQNEIQAFDYILDFIPFFVKNGTSGHIIIFPIVIFNVRLNCERLVFMK